MIKTKAPAYMAIISLLICGCQTDGGRNVEPEQSSLSECQKIIQDDNDYSKILTAYDSFMRGDIGLNNNPAFTIAPTSESKYAVLDMNNDGIPELAVTTVIFQERNSETLEPESTFFDSTIFSYKDGEVFIWGGGNQRHNPFEILSNKALLYDLDDGHGGREIIYHELDENGAIAHAIEMWNSSDGRYYLIDHAQSDSQVEISEEEWCERVDSIMVMRTDLLPWADFPESRTMPTGEAHWEDVNFHQWTGGNLLCMRQIEIYHVGKSDTVRMSIQDRIANELAEIYDEDFSSESSGWLNAQMAWHDPDYHGEPGGIYDVFQQQLIEDTHDAFLVSTGGRLGALLVTAEPAMQNLIDGQMTEAYREVWEGEKGENDVRKQQ